MDFNVISKQIAASETLFDGFDEQPVDCDFVLPDYFPDIAAVLKCTLKPVVQSKQMSGDRVVIDGTVYVQVLYLDEGRRCVRRAEFSKAFTSSVSVRSGAVNPCIYASARADYVNCRATSPRRLDIHGSFNVKIKVVAEGSSQVVSALDGDMVHTRRDLVAFSVPAAMAEKIIAVNEVLDLGADAPAAVDLIRSDAVPTLTDCRLLAGKAVVKGEVSLRTLYCIDAETGDTDSTRHIVPFSQIIDVDGLDEEWLCDIHLDVVGMDIGISTAQSGEGRLLDVSLKVLAQVQCYRTDMAEVVTDAYSTKRPLKLDTAPLKAARLASIQTNSTVVRETLDLPSDDVSAVVDVWCDAALTGERCENAKSMLDGRLNVYMLARDSAGLISFYERPSDFSVEYDDFTDCDCNGLENVSADFAVLGVEYGMTGASSMEIRTEIAVTRRCYSNTAVTAVSGVSEDENTVFPDQKAALKIYFAMKGESVWEVAKACHTSTDAVMEENGLGSDVLPADTMLLVPLC